MKTLLVVCVAVALGIGHTSAFAQATPTAAAPVRFEVASVKPSDPNASSGIFGSIPAMRPQGAGGISVSNMPLRLLVRMAYGVQDFQLVGGPSWQMSSKFDITAKAPEGTTKATQDLLPMMKALLADRFKLKTHTETRELPTYALMVARSDGKLGPDIKPSSSDCSAADAQKRAEEHRQGWRRGIALDAVKRRDDSVHDHARDQSVQPHRRLRPAWQWAGDERTDPVPDAGDRADRAR